MKPIESGLSYCRYEYDGIDNIFEFTFVGGYIHKEFVTVFKTYEGVGATLTPVEFTFINDFSIKIDKSLIKKADIIVIKRDTQGERLIDFSAGALRTPDNLDTSTRQAIDISVEAKDAYKEIEASIDEFNELANELLNTSEANQIVADNIEAVKTDANYIGNINVVAGDFNGNTDPVSMPDWGEVGVPRDPIQVPTGGNIYTVSQNIASVEITATNIDDIIKVANNIDNLPEELINIQQYTERSETAATNAEASAIRAEQAKTDTEALKASVEPIVDEVKSEGSNQILNIQTEASSAIESVKSVGTSEVQKVNTAGSTQVSTVNSTGTAQVSAVTSEGNKQIGLVTSKGTEQITAVGEQGNTQIGRVQTEGTKQIGLVKAEGDAQILRVQQAGADKITAAEASALESLQNSLEEHTTTLQGVGTAEVQKVQQQGSTSVSAVVSAKDTAITEIVQAGDEQTARASAEADRAEEAADRAESSMSVQSDWNQADSAQKDFIKNKPTLGSLASKDVVAYNEVQGTPDLTKYSTKTETASSISSAVSPKADKAYVDQQLSTKQPTGDYATKQELNLKANASELIKYWLKTDKLPAPDLGEVGVN